VELCALANDWAGVVGFLASGVDKSLDAMPMPPGEDPLAGHDKYETIDWLGEGSFGFVLLARNLHTGEEVAIKFWPRGRIAEFKTKSIEYIHTAVIVVPGGSGMDVCLLLVSRTLTDLQEDL
jgi:hypothetical protein